MNKPKILPLLLLLLALPVLTQCARTSKASKEESAAAKSFEATEDGRGTVYLYRRGRAIGAATSTQIKVNQLDAGGTGPGTFFKWSLKPGTYTFLEKTAESTATIQLDVEAGRVYFVEQIEKLGLQRGGRVKIKIVDEATGKRAVKGLKLLVSAYVPE